MVDQAKTADLVLALGGDQLLMGQYDRAIARFHEAIRIDPTCSEAYAWLGKAYKEMGRLEEAEQAFREAIQLRPDFTLAHYNLGLLYATTGQSGKALVEYDVLRTFHPIRAERLLEQISKRHDREEPDRSEESDTGEKGEPEMKLFNSISSPGEGEELEEVDSSSVEAAEQSPPSETSEPPMPEPVRETERIQRGADVQQEAEEELLSARDTVEQISAPPPDEGIETPEIAKWKQAAAANPQDATAHWQLGRAYAESGQHALAAVAIEKAIANRRDFAGSHPESVRESVEMCLTLGTCYERLGRFECAVNIYEQALDMDPDNVEAHFHLGMVAVVLSNRREAVERYQSLARLAPERAQPLLQRLLRVLSK